MDEERYRRGYDRLAETDPEAPERLIASLKDIDPELARYIIEYAFGELYSRPGLDLRSREIATIAALTALGTAQPQLMTHINAGLNVGLSRQEIIEIIVQMSAYAGFPATLNAISLAAQVFAARDQDES